MIPYNKPHAFGPELEYLAEVIKSTSWGSNGPFTKKCESLLCTELNSKKVILTNSCTDALEMSALLLNLNTGDEFITPAFTFTSTVNAFLLRGAKPCFIDIRPDTLNIDESKIESAINNNTKAIIIVHYAGVSCEMDTIMKISKKYDLPVIEDNAHGFLGSYKNKPLGSFGHLSTMSFHETKNIPAGEGGAIAINDLSFIDRSEILRDKGTNRAKFIHGEIDKYTWVDIGSSYGPSEFTAAVLWAQLEHRQLIQKRRSWIWKRYYTQLNEWANKNHVRLPYVPEYCIPSYHIFFLILPSLNIRNEFIKYMRTEGIITPFHYHALNLSPMGEKLDLNNTSLHVTESTADRIVRLPLWNDLQENHIDSIINTIKSFDRF